MSDNPLMNKMDALLKKHRGGADAPPSTSLAPPPPSAGQTDAVARTPPPNAWLPVLTQIIERGTPPAVATVASSTVLPSPHAMEPHITVATSEPVPLPPEPEVVVHPLVSEAAISDSMAEQLMSELAPRLSEVMEKQVAAELRKNLDQTVANLLSQLDVNVREIVRDAVTEKLKQPRDPSN